MSHFAHIKNGVVDAVIVISEETLAANNGWYINGVIAPISEFVQTSYNCSGGQYTKGETEAVKLALKTAGTVKDISARNRKNYAGIGYTYDLANDMFIPPRPYASWKLNKTTAQWYAPKPYPTDGKKYDWNETLLAWVVRQ